MAVNRMDDTYRNLSLEILMLSKKFIETVLHMHRHLDIWMHNMDCHTHTLLEDTFHLYKQVRIEFCAVVSLTQY